MKPYNDEEFKLIVKKSVNDAIENYHLKAENHDIKELRAEDEERLCGGRRKMQAAIINYDRRKNYFVYPY